VENKTAKEKRDFFVLAKAFPQKYNVVFTCLCNGMFFFETTVKIEVQHLRRFPVHGA